MTFKQFGDVITNKARAPECELKETIYNADDPRDTKTYTAHDYISQFDKYNTGYRIHLITQLDANKDLSSFKISIQYMTIKKYEEASIEVWYRDKEFSSTNICRIDAYDCGYKLTRFYSNTDDIFIDLDGVDNMQWYLSCNNLLNSKLGKVTMGSFKIIEDFYLTILNNN